ncbi:MAG: arylsulfatase [Mariniblastus sp.]
MRRNVESLFFTLAFLALTQSVAMADTDGEHLLRSPNIIIMMADDMGMGDTNAYQDWTGNADADQVKTPNMQRLAKMGIRFTDAHSPSSRCTATRQALLTGRYTWRTRLKYSVIWGPQGAPLIEPARPTIASWLRAKGYHTGMTGKWHCGLTYRNSAGDPEPDYEKVDLTKGIADGPVNHGFDFFHGTSRSHKTSAPQGWLEGDRVLAAVGGTKVDRSKFVLTEIGPINYAKAKQFLTEHVESKEHQSKPFFLYYACNSNHTPHTVCKHIEGVPVKGVSHPGGKRSDYIYQNDVALGLLMKQLEQTADPRRDGKPLIENTILIFTSDNGAENRSKTATGPLRSNKGSMYEGGHRVPFIATWKLGGIGDGNDFTNGKTSDSPVSLVDIFGMLAAVTESELPAEGAEDTFDILPAFKGETLAGRPPLIHNDHNEGAKRAGKKANDPSAAWMAIRLDNPIVDGKLYEGKWKLLVDEKLLLVGKSNPRELYNLAVDLKEQVNLIEKEEMQPLINFLIKEIQNIHDRGRIRK